MKKYITILTTSIAIITSILVAGSKLIDFIDKLKSEKTQLQKTLNQRTTSYYENIVYYQNELGQTIQEKEICEVTHKILAKNYIEINQHYEQIVDNLSEVIIDKEIKAEITIENIENINHKQLTTSIKSNIPKKELNTIKTPYIDPVLSSLPKKKRFLNKIFKKNK